MLWNDSNSSARFFGAENQRRTESMNRIILRFLFATLWMPALCLAQTPAPETQPATTIGPAKLGWMNLEAAMVSCDEGKKMWGDIQKFAETRRADLATMNKELETLRTQVEVQGPKLTDDAQADLQSQADAKGLALQRAQEDSQKEFEARRLKMMGYISKRMQPVIEKLAKEKGLNGILIFDRNRDAWVDPSLNLTEEIIKAYNLAYPVATPKAAVPAAPAKTP
jgi:outer membrane protein